MIKIIIVEDNLQKSSKIEEVVMGAGDNIEIIWLRTFNSACDFIFSENYPNDIGLIIADMSLPTYEKDQEELGGRFRTFAGREIARKMMRNKIITPIVFLTQYKAFSHKGISLSVEDLVNEVKSDNIPGYRGFFIYDEMKTDWKQSIVNVIRNI